MKARFSSQCPSCGDQIKQGKEIGKDSSDRWVHKHCIDEAIELPQYGLGYQLDCRNSSMVLVWIGIGIGVLIALILIRKLLKTPSHETVSVDSRCKTCGEKTHGLKCPKCSRKNTFGR